MYRLFDERMTSDQPDISDENLIKLKENTLQTGY